MLSPAQIEARDGKLTASRVACLMTGDEAKILNLWRELVGDPSFVPEDLTGVWPVRLGETTEALNLTWFSRKHGAISRIGEVITHANGWAAATLDAWSDENYCPVECKHVGGREPIEVIIERYQPQLHWQMIITDAKQVALSVIMGANEPTVEFLTCDEEYAAELLKRATAFMECVWELTPPVALPHITAPVKAEKTYDMAGSNVWASDALVWLENYGAAKVAKDAEANLKGLVPADAMRCHGYGVEIRRDKAGRLSLREHRA